MKVIIRMPETAEGIAFFHDRMAQAYVEMVKDYIIKLPWDGERKLELFAAVKDEIKRKAVNG